MTYYTHINRNVIQRNLHAIRSGAVAEPPVRIQKGKYGKPVYCKEVALPAGSRLVYSDLAPILPCGARLVIVSEEMPEIVA